MYDKNYIPSRTSPKGGRRGCLCWETSTYSIKCCDGSVRAQGVGSVYFTDEDSNLPINLSPPVISGTAERGETLSSTTGTWTGTGTITFAYQWQRDNVNISGATSSTYVLVEADDNTSINCVVTATDDVGSTSISSNAISPILGSPYNLVTPVASGTGQVGQTLSTTNGSWQGVATITFTYQWRRDASDISGATSSTYTLVADDYATDIDCVVTATNSLGSANQDSNDIANIAGSVPVISGVPTISGTAKVGETLTATAASVTGTPTPTDTFQWQRSDDGSTGWANISGAVNTTYTAVSADLSKYLRVVQTSTNEAGSDTASSASTAQVASAFDFLFDTYSTGVLAGYSMRKLSSTYEGNCIEVTQDGETFTDIGFSNNVLDQASINEIGDNGNPVYVSKVYDQSGSGEDMVQTTFSAMPQIHNGEAIYQINDKPALYYDGTDFMEVNNQHIISGAMGFYQVNYNTNAGRGFDSSDQSSNYTLLNFRFQLKLAGTQKLYTVSLPYNNQRIWFGGRNSSNEFLAKMNGNTYDISATTSTGDVKIEKLGSSVSYYDGYIQEFVIYDNDQENTSSNVITQINDFYSVFTP